MYKRQRAGLCLMVLLVAAAGVAQDAEEAADQGKPAAESSGEVEEKSQASIVRLGGDIITLQSGKKLAGVQVLRETPTGIQVEFIEGMPPLHIPRKQVLSIEYDDIDPIKQRRLKATQAQAPESGILMAKEYSPEFHRKITEEPLAEEALVFENKAYVYILTQLTKRVDVEFEVAKPISEIPKEQKRWSVEVKPGTSLRALLEEQFLKAFPQLKVDYRFDKILLTTKEAFEEGGEHASPAIEEDPGQ